jgi:hypothetical protein
VTSALVPTRSTAPPAAHLVSGRLMGVVQNTGRPTVASNGPPDVGASRCSHHARAIEHLDDQDFRTSGVNDSDDRGKRWLSHIRDQRLDPQWAGPPRLVPGPGTADRPVILDAYQEHSVGLAGLLPTRGAAGYRPAENSLRELMKTTCLRSSGSLALSSSPGSDPAMLPA